ncbi:GxGYxYP domain-containing protein [Nonomuraea sp. NPDC050153]|uniref:GxGYxYP domain-containing protein n=1 Tax=Nonomuraea sp. NPDC050153 TaxID=3364359 RepID=UPI00378C1A4E
MVSRRSFLQANGVVLAAGGLGLTLQGPAAARTRPAAPLLPNFGRPTHLDFADLTTLHGNDQLLLTTLQGVVNRRRPRLYFNYDAAAYDQRWLAGTGAAVTRHDQPLDLVARYRAEVRGAILHDPDVPDSVNVATTLAGLEDAVAATAEQAAAHGLRTVVDLRGRFDPADVLATYRWQLDHLFPRCTHALLAGLPPTRTVRVDGVRWRELARETERVRDASNRAVRAFDLSQELATAQDGAGQLLVEVDLWNQYLVTAATTAPTRVEPFPYFRDYAVATRAMVFWLPPSGGTGELLDEIFGRVEPTTPYAGWFSNDVAGEWGGVDRASQHAVEVVPADYYMNATVHAGVPARISDRVRPRPPARLRDRVYLTLTFGEGDNIQYCQRRMREIWDDPERGGVPVNWTVSPLLADIGPALLAYYQRTATAADLLVAGPSGAGYTYPGSWPAAALAAYTRLSGRFLRRTGMDLVYAYNHRKPEGDGWVAFDERIVAAYRRDTPVRGIIQSWETGDLLIDPAGLPVIGNFSPQGKAQEYRDTLVRRIEGWDGSEPLFIAGAVNAWSWTPSDVAELGGLLADPFEIVRGDTFFALLREHLSA